MASRAYQQPAPLELALSIIPSLPRPILSRLVARMIDRLDEIDGDTDSEDDNEDCCRAVDDDPQAFAYDGLPGDPADREDDDPGGGGVDDEGESDRARELPVPVFGADQRRPAIGLKWS